jgi:dTDP-4-dehydrorhamnose reductase
VRGQNFARTMLRLALQREQLSVVDDQIGAPTGADLIADVTAHAVRALLAGRASGGTYHLAAAGETSWYGYACLLLEAARARWPAHPWRVQRIDPIPSSAYPTPAPRPLNGRLDTQRLQRDFGLHLPPWRNGVLRWLEAIGAPA